jgi:hypothetical protein
MDRVPGSEHDDRRPRAARAEPPGDLEPVEVRQPEIEDDRVEHVAAVGKVETVAAGPCELDDVPVLAEEPAEQAPQTRVVLDDEKVHSSLLPAVSEGSLRNRPAGRV